MSRAEHEQRVAVGLRLSHDFAGREAAWTIVHDELLIEPR